MHVQNTFASAVLGKRGFETVVGALLAFIYDAGGVSVSLPVSLSTETLQSPTEKGPPRGRTVRTPRWRQRGRISKERHQQTATLVTVTAQNYV